MNAVQTLVDLGEKKKKRINKTSLILLIFLLFLTVHTFFTATLTTNKTERSSLKEGTDECMPTNIKSNTSIG